MDLRKSLTVPFETKNIDLSTGEFEGYASVYGSIDLGGDTIKRGAYDESLEEMRKSGVMPAMLWAHNATEPNGEWLEMRDDERGLYARGMLWVEGNRMGRASVPNAEKARNLMLANGPKGLSIGGNIAPDGAKNIEMNGQVVREITNFKLWEVSPCVFAMEPKAAVTDVKSIITPRDLERLALDTGNFSRKQAKRFVSDVFGYRDDGDCEQREADQKSTGDLSEIIALLQQNPHT